MHKLQVHRGKASNFLQGGHSLVFFKKGKKCLFKGKNS